MTKIIYSGDLHLGKRLKDNPNFKIYGHKKFKELIDKSIKENIDLLVLVGDIFDTTHPPTDTLNFTIKQIERLFKENNKVKLILLNGNHDKISSYYNNTSPILPLAKINPNRTIYKEILEPYTYEYEKYNFIILNFNDNLEIFKNTIINDINNLTKKDKINIFLSHITIQDEIFGDNEKAIYYKDLFNNLTNINYIILGDIHTPIMKEFNKKSQLFFTGSINHTTVTEYIKKDLTYLLQIDDNIEHNFLEKPNIIEVKNIKEDLEKINENSIVIISEDDMRHIKKISKLNPLYISIKEIDLNTEYLEIDNSDIKNIEKFNIEEIIELHYKNVLSKYEYELLNKIVNFNLVNKNKNELQNEIENYLNTEIEK